MRPSFDPMTLLPPAAGGPAVAIAVDRLVDALLAGAVFVVIVAGVYLPGRLLVVPALDRLLGALEVDDTVALPLKKVTGAAFAVLGVYLGIPLSGFATTPATVAAVTAGVTIAVGFASRDVLSNLASGVFIVLDPEFHIGDWIEWDDRAGVVEDISFRVTRVHTFDNETVTVPNSMLATGAVTNPGAKDRLRVPFEFEVDDDADLERVKAIAVSVADDHAEILNRPRANAHVAGFAPSAVELVAFFWLAEPRHSDVVRVRGEYVQTLKDRLDAAGIEMPSPARRLAGEVGVRALPKER